MATHSALSAGELTALALASSVKVWIDAVPMTSTETASLNGTPGFPASQLTIDGTSANWAANVRAGHTAIIRDGGASGAIKGIYRVRATPTTTTLKIGLIGQADAGLYTPDSWSALADNDHITVYTSRYDFWSVFPRIEYTGGTSGTFYKDYDTAYTNENLYPPPIVNLGSHKLLQPDSGQTYATTSFTATVTAWGGATVSTYAWTSSPAWTSDSGASTATYSGRAPSGFSTATCVVTLSTGATFTARRFVFVRSSAAISPIAISSDTSSAQGWRMTCQLTDDDLADLSDGAMVIVKLWFSRGDSGSSVSSEINTFVGWVIRESHEILPGQKSGTIDIVGPGYLLQDLTNSSQRIDQVTGTPATWQEVPMAYCKARFFAHYLFLWHAANVLSLFDFEIDSVNTSDDRLPSLIVNQGSIWQQVSGMAARAGLELTCDDTGAIRLLRHPNLTAVASRSSIVTRATLSASIVSDVSYTRRTRPAVGMVKGQANSYTATGQIVAYMAAAPGRARGQGPVEESLDEQIVDSQSTLNTRTGLYYHRRNARHESISAKIQGGWSVFAPAHLYFITLSLSSGYSPRSETIALDAIPTTIDRVYNPDGTMDIQISAEPETSGPDAETLPVPPPDLNILGDFGGGDWTLDLLGGLFDLGTVGQPFDIGAFTYDPAALTSEDPSPGASTVYGRMGLVTADSDAPYVVRVDWTGSGAGYTNISPTAVQQSEVGTAVRLVEDPYYRGRAVLRGAYAVAYTNDWRTGTPAWSVIGGGRSTVVNFGATGLPYTVTTGTLKTGNGTDITPYNGSWVQATLAAPSVFDITVNLYTPTNVTGWSIRMQRNRLYVGGAINNATLYVYFYDSTGALITSDSKLISSSLESWELWTSGTLSVSGVASMRVTMSQPGWFGNTVEVGIDEFMISTGTTIDPVAIGDFQPVLAKKNAYYWLSQAANLMYFNVTTDFFSTHTTYPITAGGSQAQYVGSDVNYSFTVSPHDYKHIIVAAGKTSVSGNAALYESTDGGATWTKRDALNTRGGLPWWNRATGTPNTPNTATSNLLWAQGLDGSNNFKVGRGFGDTPVTVATGSGKYGGGPLALWALPRDLDYVTVIFQDLSVYHSSDAGDTWAAKTSAPAGASGTARGIWGYPADSAFLVAFGYPCFAYTKNTGTAWTNEFTGTYDTWRSANLGASVGETIVNVIIDTSRRFSAGVV